MLTQPMARPQAQIQQGVSQVWAELTLLRRVGARRLADSDRRGTSFAAPLMCRIHHRIHSIRRIHDV
jgi:hypothetical protein